MPKEKSKKLPPRKQRFAEEFLEDLNGEKAAKRAGYSEKSAKSQASQIKSDPEVQAEIQRQMDERSKRTKITADYVLFGIKDTIDRCKQAEKVMQWDPIAKEMVFAGEWKFDAANALRGYELLGKHLKLFSEVIVHKDDVSKLSDEELEKIVLMAAEEMKKKGSK